MSNIEKKLAEIEKNKSKMLGYYKDLVVKYEEVRQLQVAIIDEYESNADVTTVVRCSKIRIENTIPFYTKWELLNEVGEIIYSTNAYIYAEEQTIDLSTLNIPVGTVIFRLKANVKSAPDAVCETKLAYYPDELTANFKLTGGLLGTTLSYLGVK